MNIGRFYGKIVDSTTGKPIEFAAVQFIGSKYDTVKKAMRAGSILGGQLSAGNGDFSVNELPIFGKITLRITALGYDSIRKEISFNINMGEMMGKAKKGMSGDENSMSAGISAINAFDKDLGNIKMHPNAKVMKAVVIEEDKPVFELKLDKKVYNVDKDMTVTGGTAEDVLKKVPTVNVDMDGNVTMRNAEPQIFVDGKPSTLTIDQIPADAIEKIELITNPSAKYDASGGQGGIINIVLKKARRIGYNGNLRAGVDQRGKLNGLADLNTREGKFNFFITSMFNQRKFISYNHTERLNKIGFPTRTNIFQDDTMNMNGYFGFGRAGFDYFIDNRNTITLNGMYVVGSFSPEDNAHTRTDTLDSGGNTSNSTSYFRRSNTGRDFKNYGASLQYKHLYPKADKELTADLNYNQSTSSNTGNITTDYYNMNGQTFLPTIFQKQDGSGSNVFFTGQADYVNPVNEKVKIETGVRASIRTFESRNDNFLYNYFTDNYQKVNNQNSNYRYSDEVYAAYFTYGRQVNKFSFQAGLRVESSFYSGELLDSAKKFSNQYPVAPFPSFNASYKLSDKNDLQFSYSRRVNRPSFFQLIPYTDYTDSLNLSKGNPNLLPEFTNSLEANWMHTFDRNKSILFSVYFKNTTGLISRYQAREYDSVLMKNVVINTYQNANSSYAYGAELTWRTAVKSWLELTLSGETYNSHINASNLETTLTNDLVSYKSKANITFKLPKNLSIQLSTDYKSKTIIPSSRGENKMYGMSMQFGGGNPGTIQGYNLPGYGIDIGIKKEFGKSKQASVTLNCSDVFKTKQQKTYSESDFLTQTSVRKRDQQFFRIDLSYRFGKFDVSLFKRKNMKMNTEGMEGVGGG